MPPHRLARFALSLLLAAIAAGCGGPPKEKTIYWRGETWDGMNRMVFALQDLGWELETVDTDEGKILASIARDGGEESGARGRATTATDPAAARSGDAGASDAAGRDLYRIVVRFPKSPETPVSIEPEDTNDEAYRANRFLRKIAEIKKRFEWYGGKYVEVAG